VHEFRFADIGFPAGLRLPSVYHGNADYQLLSQTIVGNPSATMEHRQDELGRQYRYLQPSILREVYQPTDRIRTITVNRRRGFGQYALVKEFQGRAIGIFMHRSDSPGEAGSNVYFLANMNARHEPCGRLFDKLSRKLADSAPIIGDGSNSHIRRLKRYHWQGIDGATAYSIAAQVPLSWGGFSWQYVGYMSNKYGPTLVWGVTRQN
jgi:hypothetical protein